MKIKSFYNVISALLGGLFLPHNKHYVLSENTARSADFIEKKAGQFVKHCPAFFERTKGGEPRF